MAKLIFQIIILKINFMYLLCSSNFTLYFDFHFDKKISFTLCKHNLNKNADKYYSDDFYFFGHIIDISQLIKHKKDKDDKDQCKQKLDKDDDKKRFYKQFLKQKENEPKFPNQKKNTTNNSECKKIKKSNYKINHDDTILFLSSIEHFNQKSIKMLRKFTLIIPYSLKKMIVRKNIIFNNTMFFLMSKDEIKFKYCVNNISSSNYFITIGKNFDDNLFLKLECICFLLLLILITLFYQRGLKHTRRENKLPIHYLLSILIGILIALTISVNFCMHYLFEFKYYYILDYLNIFVYSIYKGMLFSIIISLLKGWLILNFHNFSKIMFIIIFLYNFVLAIIFSNIIYYSYFYNKLTLFFIKNILGYLIIIVFICISLITKYLKMNKQILYEKKIKSNLIKCYQYKRKKLFIVNLYALLYCIVFGIQNTIENNNSEKYVNSFLLYSTHQIIIEIVFVIILCLIFFPTKLPKYYFKYVIFNYIEKKILLAHIGENNITNFEELQYSAVNKKKEIIVFVGPFSKKEKEMWGSMKFGCIRDNS